MPADVEPPPDIWHTIVYRGRPKSWRSCALARSSPICPSPAASVHFPARAAVWEGSAWSGRHFDVSNEVFDYVTVLIEGPPDLVTVVPDLHERFVQVPNVAAPALATLEPSSVLQPEFPTRLPDVLVRVNDPLLRRELPNVAQPWGVTALQPNTIVGHLRLRSVAIIAVRISTDTRNLAGRDTS